MENKRKYISIILCIIMSGLLIIGFNLLQNSNPNPKLLSSKACYMLLPTIKQLSQESEYIVIGTVYNVNNPFKVNLMEFRVSKKSDNTNPSPVYATSVESNIKIDKVLKGDLKSDKIELLQSIDDKISAYVCETDKKNIFFLKYFIPKTEAEIKYYKSPKFIPVNAIQSDFMIEDNKVNLEDRIFLDDEGLSGKNNSKQQLLNSRDNIYSIDEIEKVITSSNKL